MMTTMYKAMMTLPIDKQESFMSKILELDAQHQDLQTEGEGYLDIVREAWQEDNPGENKEADPNEETPSHIEEPFEVHSK